MSDLRGKLSPTVIRELDALRSAPVLLNCDRRHGALALSEFHQAECGIGDHALTIFDTSKTFVFDQSHMLFDGSWGAALAKILTNEALSWTVYLNSLPPAQRAKQKLYSTPRFDFRSSDHTLISNAPRIAAEAGAESDEVNLNASLNLRKFSNNEATHCS